MPVLPLWWRVSSWWCLLNSMPSQMPDWCSGWWLWGECARCWRGWDASISLSSESGLDLEQANWHQWICGRCWGADQFRDGHIQKQQPKSKLLKSMLDSVLPILFLLHTSEFLCVVDLASNHTLTSSKDQQTSLVNCSPIFWISCQHYRASPGLNHPSIKSTLIPTHSQTHTYTITYKCICRVSYKCICRWGWDSEHYICLVAWPGLFSMSVEWIWANYI